MSNLKVFFRLYWSQGSVKPRENTKKVMVVNVFKYLIETCQQMLKGTVHVISSSSLFKELQVQFIICPLNLELSKE